MLFRGAMIGVLPFLGILALSSQARTDFPGEASPDEVLEIDFAALPRAVGHVQLGSPAFRLSVFTKRTDKGISFVRIEAAGKSEPTTAELGLDARMFRELKAQVSRLPSGRIAPVCELQVAPQKRLLKVYTCTRELDVQRCTDPDFGAAECFALMVRWQAQIADKGRLFFGLNPPASVTDQLKEALKRCPAAAAESLPGMLQLDAANPCVGGSITVYQAPGWYSLTVDIGGRQFSSPWMRLSAEAVDPFATRKAVGMSVTARARRLK